MKARFFLILFGIAFSVTLAIIVGQRLSSEAMAVIVGVVAGVAASIPTSLIVVWFATRTANMRTVETHRSAPIEPEPPRVVVMAPPTQPAYSPMPGYPQVAAGMYPQMPMANPFAPRQFNVIGGADSVMPEAEQPAEVVWPR